MKDWRQSPFVSRLQSADVINRGMLFAAVLLLCFVPFLIIVQSLVGRRGATGLIKRFGLTEQAAYDVRHVLTSPSATSGTISGLSWVFFILGGIAAAAAIQELYEHGFGVEGRGLKDVPRRIVWLAVAVGVTFLSGWLEPWLQQVGGLILIGVVALIGATAFWWFTMWLLLSGKRAWRELFPCALATGICWLGMVIVFRLTLSSAITLDYRKYGSIGVVFALMSLLIAQGVVIMLGAILGLIWGERRERRSSGLPRSG